LNPARSILDRDRAAKVGVWLRRGAILLCSVLSLHAGPPRDYRVYFGTYTGAKSKGIYVARFDTATGRLSEPELAAETKSPSFLAVHPNRRVLYAVGETTVRDGQRAGAVNAFAIAPKTGRLTWLNQQSSGGLGPCHLAVDAQGRCALVANYTSGSIASLPILPDGRLGPPASTRQHHGSGADPRRQAGPHAHCVVPDPGGRFALACDLGLDQVLVYRLDAGRATLTAHDPPFGAVPPGAGPRHLAFSPDGKFVYVINELGSSLTTFRFDPQRGELRAVQTISALPENFTGQNTCAEVQVHPSGRFVYGSNRGHDSIAVFAADKESGRLRLVEHQSSRGKSPRHFAIEPGGAWLLAENQGSDSVVVFQIDAPTGRLQPTGQSVTVGAPVCAVFLPGD
jgi:6-phosphogluconolactonase